AAPAAGPGRPRRCRIGWRGRSHPQGPTPMSAVAEPTLDVAELGRLLQAADPAALLVPSRLLRRVIKHDRKMTILGLRVPHRKSYVIGRDALLGLAAPDELRIEPDRELPDPVLLLERPEPEDLADLPRGAVLVEY